LKIISNKSFWYYFSRIQQPNFSIGT
jgi:hypothetical protein